MTGRRMLLTGGSGFLGSRLALLAAACGWRVWATHLNNPVPEAGGVTTLRLDLSSGAAELDRVLAEVRPEAVLHTAYSMSDAALNIDGTRKLVAGCAGLERPPYFLYTSTDLVFDGRRGRYTEQDIPEPVLDYGRQKLQAEREVLEYLPEAAIVRTSLIYDLLRHPRHLDFALRATKRGEAFSFFTDEYRSPVLADELAGAILELCGRALGGYWHIAGADRVDRWWFGTHLMAALGYATEYARRGKISDVPGDRPADCSLDCGKLNSDLDIRLSGARSVLGRYEVKG